jgi:lysozyme
MSDFSAAIELIRKYEGYNEKAYPDPTTGTEPYTIGYGTQFYPDGSPVRRGHLCTKRKALEYLYHELEVLDTELKKLNLGLDGSMHQALLSFIHSVGWNSFLYSNIIDCLEREDWLSASQEIPKWVFDQDHKMVGALLHRRQEEVLLFLREANNNTWVSTEILLAAFRNYSAAPHQVKAIRMLERSINPYTLSEFANQFKINQDPWNDFFEEEGLNEIFDMAGICDI